MSTSTSKAKKSTGTNPSRGTGAVSQTLTKSKRGGAAPSIDSQSRMRKTIYGGASRTLMSSSSRKNVQLAGSDRLTGPSRAPVQVLDEEGQDVTPLPLLHLDPATVRKNQSNILADSSAGTPTDLMSQASIYQTGTVTASTFGGGPFTRSVFSASQSGRSTGSITDDIGEPSSDPASAWAGLSEIKHQHEEVTEDLSESDLDKIVDITLTETDTIFLLDMPAISVSNDSDEAAIVTEQNERYEQLVKSRVGNDRYAERGMNTFNEPPKTKGIQTTKIAYNDTGVMATDWDMYDTYKAIEEGAKAAEAAKDDEEEDAAGSQQEQNKEETTEQEKDKGSRSSSTALLKDASKASVQRSGIESQATMSSMAGTDSVFASKESGVVAIQPEEVDKNKEILESEELRGTLVIMERVVNQNIYQSKQASFRGLPVLPDVDIPPKEDDDKPPSTAQTTAMAEGEAGPNLDRLWAYHCPLTKGRNVSCISWNKLNLDLVAVGYGQFDFTGQKSGMVCCWSLKNPEFPERIFTCTQGVTAMDFSVAHPNLLAVGLYDGTVVIYNVRRPANETILDSFKDVRSNADYESSGKHTGPVWQLKWIEKERGSGEEKAEVLVSVSTDGRVTQWSIRKGFESYDLMKLKRVAAKSVQGKTKKSEAFISKFAGGLCFDFSLRDPNIYLVGTEEGQIHKCSCSYNEQYLDSYISHSGPVYAVQWSPFCPDVFISSSSDWSLKLWHQDRLQPILTFHSSTKAMHDVCWSPYCSTVFACVNEGAVEVWDLSKDILDPIHVHDASPPGTKLSSVTFSKNSHCVLVGDSEGQVSVFKLTGMAPPSDKQADALNKVIQSSLASQLQSK